MPYKFVKLKSKSGVPVWFYETPYAKSVAMGVLINVGTRDEKPQEAGLIHALEHILPYGTKQFPNSRVLSGHIELIGGEFECETSHNATLYWTHLPIRYIKRGFKILSQTLKHPLIPSNKIPIEIRNIIGEIREENDRPEDLTQKIFLETVYNKHPLGKSILGTEKTLPKFIRKDFLGFMSRFYYPANFTFIITGNIKAQRAINLFNSYFPEKIERESNQRDLVFQTKPKKRRVILRKEIEQAHIVLGNTTTKVSDRLSLALSVFSVMIGGGASFPLFQEIRDKQGLGCYSIRTQNLLQHDLGCFFIYMAVDRKKVNKAINTTLKVIKKSKNSSELLKAAKNTILGGLALEYGKIEEMLNYAAWNIALGIDPLNDRELIKQIKSVTIEEVETAVNTFLAEDKLVKVMLLPK